MKVAALDLGSNTFLLLITEVNSKGEIENVLHDEAVVTRLSEGVNETKLLASSALDRAEKCFSSFSATIKKLSVQKVYAVATSAARDAKNSELFFDLAAKFDIPLRVISGQEEAELTFLGALGSQNNEGKCVIDIGGGSTEIMAAVENKIVGKSMDIGCARLTEKFISSHPTPMEELDKIENFIAAEFSKNVENLPKNIDQLIAVDYSSLCR